MLNVIGDPHFWLLVGLYWIFNAAVGALPEPDERDTKGYQWAYRFVHTLAGNITSAFGSKIPGNVNLALNRPTDPQPRP